MTSEYDFSVFEVKEHNFSFANLTAEEAEEKKRLYEQFVAEKEEMKKSADSSQSSVVSGQSPVANQDSEGPASKPAFKPSFKPKVVASPESPVASPEVKKPAFKPSFKPNIVASPESNVQSPASNLASNVQSPASNLASNPESNV
jgi:NADH-quinone oxidoreductase subunit I